MVYPTRNNVDLGIRQNLFALYLQDDWKLSPRLTVNLGVRYEGTTSPTEVGTGEFIKTEDPFTTNICFGGNKLQTAYLTFSWQGLLVACDWPRPGFPLNFLNT